MDGLDAALECQPTGRRAFLAEVCARDPQLGLAVEKLLDRHDKAELFMEDLPITGICDFRDAEEVNSMIGRRVGLYRIKSEIGRGGMGTVYLAESDGDDYQRQVAIKLIKRGMDTDSVLRRFRNERQILASLNHPNIARLYHGGTTDDGLPFFVLEYVEGLPINEYCAVRKLSMGERLKLFSLVCAAVQYAHQHLVVHRDLKPSNILVTPAGEPKLLDFGIAKLLQPGFDEHREVTATELRVMTPEYASPEQVRGLPVTTGTDIYSLGVLLYELLTERRPYKITSRRADEIVRVICGEEPEKPSQVSANSPSQPADVMQSPLARKMLRGDLDNIVLMAMRKEPTRRYATVAELFEDIRRHLEGRPVHARKDTLSYRTTKFINRNKLTVTAAALILVTLIAGIAAASWKAHLAEIERARAERRFRDLRRLATSMTFEFDDSIKQVPGTIAARQDIVKRGLDYLDILAQEAETDVGLQSELAVAYDKIGTLTFDVDKALLSHSRALSINQSLVDAEPANTKYLEQLAESYGYVGDIWKEKGNASIGVENYSKSLSIIQELSNAAPANQRLRGKLREAHINAGLSLAQTGQFAAALDNYRQALEFGKQLAANDPQNQNHRSDQAIALMLGASALADSGDFSAALKSHDQSLTICESLSASDPANKAKKLALWAAQLRLGETLMMMNRPVEALAHHERAMSLILPLAEADPADLGQGHHLALTYLRVGQALAQLGSTDRALKNFHESIRIAENLLAQDPNKAEIKIDLAKAFASAGSLLVKTREPRKGLELLSTAVALQEGLVLLDPQNDLRRRELSIDYAELAEGYTKVLRNSGVPSGERALARQKADCWYELSRDEWQKARPVLAHDPRRVAPSESHRAARY